MADELLFSDVANYRYNPFTDTFSPNVISNENRTIPASPPYQVVLFESPQENSPSTTNITLTIGGTQLIEVSKTTTPGNLQYRVNYDEQSNGIVEFNSGQAGLEVDIDYYGLGTLYSKDAVEALLFDGTKTFENITVTNDLDVGGDILTSATSKILTGGLTTGVANNGGVSIKQTVSADKAITIENTTITHPFTSITTENVFCIIRERFGLDIRGFTDVDGIGIKLSSYVGVTSPTSSAIRLDASKSDGSTSNTTLADTEIITSFSNNGTVEASIYGNGDLSINGGLDAGNSGTSLKTEIVDIGDWNMDTTTSVNVAHGLSTDALKIRGIQCVIRNDSNTVESPLDTWGSTATVAQGQLRSWTTTNVTLDRLASGFYDNTSYDSTSYNRGWIYITYEA
jgi:hypothetical protein